MSGACFFSDLQKKKSRFAILIAKKKMLSFMIYDFI